MGSILVGALWPLVCSCYTGHGSEAVSLHGPGEGSPDGLDLTCAGIKVVSLCFCRGQKLGDKQLLPIVFCHLAGTPAKRHSELHTQLPRPVLDLLPRGRPSTLLLSYPLIGSVMWGQVCLVGHLTDQGT